MPGTLRALAALRAGCEEVLRRTLALASDMEAEARRHREQRHPVRIARRSLRWQCGRRRRALLFSALDGRLDLGASVSSAATTTRCGRSLVRWKRADEAITGPEFWSPRRFGRRGQKEEIQHHQPDERALHDDQEPIRGVNLEEDPQSYQGRQCNRAHAAEESQSGGRFNEMPDSG